MIYREKKEYSKSVQWVQRAADMGHLNAIDLLGDMYRDGLGVQRNPTKAFELYRKAADKGLKTAFFSLARAYENGRGVGQNPAEAFRCMSVAAEDGDDVAQKCLGDYYCDGVGVPIDGQKALSVYQLAVNQGYAPAKTAIGKMYERGLGVSMNTKLAVHWYEQACNADAAGLKANPSTARGGRPDKEAFGSLGLLYWDGIGVEPNKDKGMQFLTEGAKRGDDLSCGFVGASYLEGDHLERNVVLGQKYLAEVKDDISIYCRMGSRYFKQKNFVECRLWTERGARQNDPDAQCKYAHLLEQGLGGAKDIKTALSWYEKAATRGHPEALARAPVLRALLAKSAEVTPPVEAK